VAIVLLLCGQKSSVPSSVPDHANAVEYSSATRAILTDGASATMSLAVEVQRCRFCSVTGVGAAMIGQAPVTKT